MEIFQQNFNKKRNKLKGFTLIEMMVATSIFVIVAMIAGGVFVTMTQASKKAQSIKMVVDNLNFAMDSMVINMKTGRNYNCLTGGSPCTSIEFTTMEGGELYYRLDDKVLQMSNNGSDWFDLTGLGIRINYLDFDIDNSGQPKARILVNGEMTSYLNIKTDFSLQTLVSQRNL